MTVGEAQRSVSSAEFSEWIAFYMLEAEMSGLGERESTEEETVARLRGFAAAHNARLAARGPR